MPKTESSGSASDPCHLGSVYSIPVLLSFREKLHSALVSNHHPELWVDSQPQHEKKWKWKATNQVHDPA